MKDFMLIFISKSYQDMGLSPEEMQSRMGSWWQWNQKMEAKGIVKDGNPLHPNARRISGEKRTVTDVTSAELKEIVGGYYIISAKDIEEASQIAADYPDYDIGGTVEIREIIVYEG